jgi:hypothetical protein
MTVYSSCPTNGCITDGGDHIMTKTAMVFIGMGLVSVPFATYSHAEMKSGNLPDANEIGSPKPRGAIQAGETDMTNTKGQGGLPIKYTIMPVAIGKKIEVNKHSDINNAS